jgi:UDP-N-acetylmuramyl pentapeptide phosphotransferase/UDP-N-acetylglucosamine-1-phosphate transferase
LPIIALPLAALGLADDRVNLPAALRYFFQALTAVILVLISPLPLPIAWLTVPLLLIAITAVINFTNFMDGLDGLVAGCIVVTSRHGTVRCWWWYPAATFRSDRCHPGLPGLELEPSQGVHG